MRTHMHTPESGRVFFQSQQRRRCIQQQRRHADMIGDQMTGRFFRVTDMEGAVIMMMMTFVLPVQHRVLKVSQRCHRNAATRQCHGLPQHGKQHGDEDGTASHRTQFIQSRLTSKQVGAWQGIRRRIPACSSRHTGPAPRPRGDLQTFGAQRRAGVAQVVCPTAAVRQYPLMADLRRPARRIARSKPAGQILILNVSKVAAISPTGAPALGHKQPVANDCSGRDYLASVGTREKASRSAVCSLFILLTIACLERAILAFLVRLNVHSKKSPPVLRSVQNAHD
jgi:hypothetical protein